MRRSPQHAYLDRITNFTSQKVCVAARLIPVILCGGSGSRLWPMSRKLLPKQFLPLVGERTLFQDTVLRTRGMPQVQAPIVITNAEHRFMAADQLREIGVAPRALLLEPAGRNTAPAIAAAALQAGDGADAILVVQPSDHLIGDVAAFQAAVGAALAPALDGYLVTFGVPPSHAATGYGYIEAGEPLGEQAFGIRRFVEKPGLEQAQAYLASGRYLWNSGMFVFLARCFLEELERFSPEILAAARSAVQRASADLDFIRLDKDAFCASPSNSIDYAAMERTDRKSTRLNSSHLVISYGVFCVK